MTKLANPFSTGGGGITFENQVQASFLVAMVVGAPTISFQSGTIKKIKLQGKRDGYETDDLIIFVEDNDGHHRKLLGQVKHQVHFTKSDETFSEVLKAAWGDFQNNALFDPSKDKIALITGRLSRADSNSMITILEWARFSESASDFVSRVKTKRYSSDDKRNKLAVLDFHLAKIKGSPLSEDELWTFCKSWQIFSYDFGSEQSTALNGVLSVIAASKSANAPSPQEVWRHCISLVAGANQNAGTLVSENIDPSIKGYFLQGTLKIDDIQRLKEHAGLILKRINDEIGGFHLKRKDLINELVSKITDGQLVLVSGNAGSGKSALVLDVLRDFTDDVVFYFRSEDLNYSHIDAALSSVGLKGKLSSIIDALTLIPRKIMVIESIEKLLELDNSEALLDLLKILQDGRDWKVVATCRSYSVPQLMSFFLEPIKVYPTQIEIPEFGDDELDLLKEKLPVLKPLLQNPEAKSFLRNPFFLSFTYKVADSLGTEVSLEKLRTAIWTDVIGKSADRKNGMPLRRIEAFIEVAIRRARQMSLSVEISGIDAAAILALESDGIITRFAGDTFAPSHDLLEDWAIERFIEQQFIKFETDPSKFFDVVGSGLAFRRTFRHWFQRLMTIDEKRTNVRSFILNAFASPTLPRHWKDEITTCLLLSSGISNFLTDLSAELFKGDFVLLRRFIFVLRITCKGPDQSTMKTLGLNVDTSSLFASRFLKPIGPGWHALVRFLVNNKSKLDFKMLPHVVPLLYDWTTTMIGQSQDTDQMKDAGNLALHFLSFLKVSYRDENLGEVAEILVRAYPGIKTDFENLLNTDLFNKSERKPRYIEKICEIITTSFAGSFLCRYNPELVVKVCWAAWKSNESEEDYRHSLDIEQYFGLHTPHTTVNFTNPSALKGPFWALLDPKNRVGLDFIIDLTNFAADRYSRSSLGEGEVTMIELEFDSSKKVKQIFSNRLWNAYVGASVTPGQVNCALMALEKWLVDRATKGEAIEADVTYILEKSKSVFTTAVLAGIASGFWPKVGKSLYPILKCRYFYSADNMRMVSGQSSGSFNWFGFEGYDPGAEIYRNERKTANSYKWRKSTLEDVVRSMLFSKFGEDVGAILDHFYEQLPPEESQTKEDIIWRIALGRMDLRKYSMTEDVEKGQVTLTAPEPPQEIQEVHNESAKQLNYQGRFMTLNLWGTQKFRSELVGEKYYSSWKEALEEAKWVFGELEKKNADESVLLFSGGLFYTTAYCVRDHLPDIGQTDRDWIVDLYLRLIRETDSRWLMRSFDESGANGFHAAAYCLPKLLMDTKIKSAKKRSEIKKAIVHALIHPDTTISKGTATGIRDFLWEEQKTFAESCFAGSVRVARVHTDLYKYYHPHDDRTRQNNLKMIADAFGEIRKETLAGKVKFSVEDFSFEKYSSWDLKVSLLMIPDKNPSANCLQLLREMFQQFIKLEKDRDRSNDRVDYKTTIAFEDKLAKIFLKNSFKLGKSEFGTILKDIAETPELGAGLIGDILYSDAQVFINGEGWEIWNYFAGLVSNALIEESQKSWDNIKWSKKDKLGRALMFDGAEWKGRDFEANLMTSGKKFILDFFTNTGCHPDVFESFIKLCQNFPSIFLPDALPTICKFVGADTQRKLLRPVNAKYYLEQLIMKFVVSNFRSLKGNPSMSNGLLQALDRLIDDGSSTAYYIRERVVTLM